MTVGDLKHFLGSLSDNMEIVFKVMDEEVLLEDIGIDRPLENLFANKDNDLKLVIQVSRP